MKIFKNYPTASILVLICLVKLISRALIHGNLHLFFLVWNLILAIVPYAISDHALKTKNFGEKKIQTYGYLLIWLLFLPNAFYVFTDFIHLRLSTAKTFWWDFITIASFATTAWWFGLKSLAHIKIIWITKLNKNWFEIYDYVFPFLMALGVYMGRFDRFNSWDIVSQPHEIVFTAIKHITNFQILVICLFYGFLIHISMFSLKPRSPSPDGNGSLVK